MKKIFQVNEHNKHAHISIIIPGKIHSSQNKSVQIGKKNTYSLTKKKKNPKRTLKFLTLCTKHKHVLVHKTNTTTD